LAGDGTSYTTKGDRNEHPNNNKGSIFIDNFAYYAMRESNETFWYNSIQPPSKVPEND
jgi:hypothetical protein